MAKNEKKFPYMGGVIAYRPAGSFTDEDTKELKEYDAAVKGGDADLAKEKKRTLDREKINEKYQKL